MSSERRRNHIVAFYGGIFSNWYPCEFKNNRGELFTSTEQYMMYRKAEIFGDKAIAAKILTSDSPAECKRLGRRVKNFDEDAWKKNRCRVMIRGLYYKFSQNKNLCQLILATGDDTLVEASPVDLVWGVGVGLNHPDIFDPTKYRGCNLLGKCLVVVRQMLRDNGFVSI